MAKSKEKVQLDDALFSSLKNTAPQLSPVVQMVTPVKKSKRDGKVQAGFWIEEEIHDDVVVWAAQEKTTVGDLYKEAVLLLRKTRGRPDLDL